MIKPKLILRFRSLLRLRSSFGSPSIAVSMILLVSLVAAAWAHPAVAEPNGEQPLRVATTLPPLAWLVAQVAGPAVEVWHLLDPGDQPETFQPSDLRITNIARSAIFFRIGIPAENGPWLRALEQSGRVRVVDLRQGIEMRTLAGHTHHSAHRDSHSSHSQDSHSQDNHSQDSHSQDSHSQDSHSHSSAGLAQDPHVWLSPRRLEVMGWVVCRSLSSLDPAGADGYAKRAAGLERQLKNLDQDLRGRLEPVRNRAFFVFHPTWGYFADDYGLRQIAVEIEGKEPTERELTRLMNQAQRLGIRTIFVQPQIRSSMPRHLAEMLGARVESLDPLALNVATNLQHVADRMLAALQDAEPRP